MILVIKNHTPTHEIHDLLAKLAWMKLQAVHSQENGRDVVAIVSGVDSLLQEHYFTAFTCVEKVLPLTQKFKLAGREIKQQRSVITINHHRIGDGSLTIIAGPCAIESQQQIESIAQFVSSQGAQLLRGGAFKPRTSPYDFQGLGRDGLRYMEQAAKQYRLISVSEVMDTADVDLVATHIDVLQIGARNMQNFSLLKAVGKSGKPVLLKRGLSATYADFLMAAEYILQTGNPNVILCERGIRTFETYTRNTLDIAAVPILKELSHLPVIVDPSHGTGIRRIVPTLACAAVAAGCDGVLIEVHPQPDQSISDAAQTISFESFAKMMKTLHAIDETMRATRSECEVC